jgi:glycosyltransferase involved in cell wall biosynthesis
VRQEQVDVLHMTYNAPFWSHSSAQVVSVHDLAYKLYPHYYSSRVRLLLSTLVPLSIRRAERVIVISEQTKQNVIREYGISPDKIVLTPLAAAPEFRVQADPAELRRVLACYGIQAPYVLAVGNLEPRKNLVRIIRAFASLLDNGLPPHQLVIAGKAHWQGSVVGQEIERLGLGNQAILTGYVSTDDLVSLYNAARLFCYPSLHEGFGLPILEAMSCGAPVITSNTSSMPEVAGAAAWLVDPCSEQDLATAMERILTDEAQRRELREKGLRRAADFSWAYTAQLTLQAYQDAWTAHRQKRRGPRPER